jgi:creatinine amidohydrolase
VYLPKLKWPEIKQLDFNALIALVPLGSIEQHSWHLPLSVDADIITELAQRVERKRAERVVLLPTQWLGHSPHHRFFACLSLDVRPYMDLIKGLCDSLVLMGFRKVLLLNGHGGNEIVTKAALREIKSKHEAIPDLKIGFSSYWVLGGHTLQQTRESLLGGVGHACEMETAMMLRIRPESVDMSKARTTIGPFGTDNKYRLLDAQHSRPVYFVDEFSEVSDNGGIGNPELATAEKGEKFLDGFTREILHFIDEFASW